MKYSIFIIIAICLVASSAKAQDFDTVLKAATDNYIHTEMYEIEANYNLYAHSDSDSLIDQQHSVFIKHQNDLYFKIAESELVQTATFSLKISHTEKMLLYAKSYGPQAPSSQLPYLELERHFSKKTIADKGKYWVCEMDANTSISIPYRKIVLHIEKASHNILKQVYFLNESSSNNIGYATLKGNERLEIVATRFTASPKDIAEKFELSRYLDLKENTLTSTDYTKNYKIIVQ